MARTDRRPRHRLDPDSRRAAIMDSAVEAFSTHPYRDVTIASIARTADSSSALVYRYFESKEMLYTEVVRRAIEDLMAAQAAALAQLSPGVPTRDRIRTATAVYLDHIADHPDAWATPLRQQGGEPPGATALRDQARARYIGRLGDLLEPSDQPRHGYALRGYFGFIDTACLSWAEQGCPEEHRGALLDAILGALEGALGDWAA